MSKISLDTQALGQPAGHVKRANVGGVVGQNARPTMVTLESGIKAIIEVAGFPYIKCLPLSECGAHEDIDARTRAIADSERINLKGVDGA
jgi:hypothetical protein